MPCLNVNGNSRLANYVSFSETQKHHPRGTVMPKRGCLGIPLSLIEALNTTKIPIPGKRGRKVGVLGILISLIVLCCAGIGIYGAADVSLRAAGVLPTLTLTPSGTTEPTATSTATRTPTAGASLDIDGLYVCKTVAYPPRVPELRVLYAYDPGHNPNHVELLAFQPNVSISDSTAFKSAARHP
jgi:hypothetical protein